MRRCRKLQLAVAAGVILLARAATADPPPTQAADIPGAAAPTSDAGTTGGGSPSTAVGLLHIATPSALDSDGGSRLQLPAGYFMSEPIWNKLDAEMKRLQDVETRCGAEERVMKAALEKWQPGWWTLASVAVGAAALGWYAHDKL